jgi:hypothetical protein
VTVRRWRAASTVALGLTLMAAAPAMPDAFARLPKEARERATVVVSGRYRVGRGPCELLPDGSRRWPLLRGFATTAVHRGGLRGEYIGVAEPRLLGPDEAEGTLTEGEEYLLLLRPSEASIARLRTREGNSDRRHALASDEVVAIVPRYHLEPNRPGTID